MQTQLLARALVIYSTQNLKKLRDRLLLYYFDTWSNY